MSERDRQIAGCAGFVQRRTIGIWGLAFKPDTDDVREAPSLDIAGALLEAGARVKAYDPIAMNNFRKAFNHPGIEYCGSALEAAAAMPSVCSRSGGNSRKRILSRWLK